MKTITLQCPECGKEFSKPLKEYNRNQRLGRRSFCGLGCSAKAINRECPKGHKDFYKKYGYKRSLDQFSPFRWFHRRIRARKNLARRGETDLTLQDLKTLWESQNGICPYTRIKMDLPSGSKPDKEGLPARASLDRIDSSKGYVRGNVEFVCLSVNYAKNGFSKEQMQDFIRQIRNN